ncbi:MAG TPA: hypothetical protein VMW44_00610 [Candidatus Bathyarchaeia archaeon]|nr:hypothetical protein [Candidatus Bathyarchaeia archaeon]
MSESKIKLRNTLSEPKTYVSVRPGYTLTLPEGVEFNNGKTRVTFDSEKAKEFTTNEKEIQEYLESLDKFGIPGQPPKNPLVQTQYFYCPTPEEVAEAEAQVQLAKNIAFIKANPLFKINVKDLTYTQLCDEAKKFNIAVVTDKNTKRPGADIAEELEALFEVQPTE